MAIVRPMSNAAPSIVTPEEYLTLERAAETKSEYHDGRIVAMAGGTGPHALLAATLIRELGNLAKSKGCHVFTSDMKVRVDANNRYLYPDASGLCGRPEYLDDARDVLVNPAFIIEVLSKSTEAYDRGRKLAIYMALPTVVEIALVSLVELRVDKYTRQPDGIWRFDGWSGAESSVPFVSLGGAVALREVYEGIELEPLPPEPGSERIR